MTQSPDTSTLYAIMEIIENLYVVIFPTSLICYIGKQIICIGLACQGCQSM